MKRTDFSVDWLFAACAPDTELLPWNAQFTPVDLPHDWQIRHADDLYRDGTLFYRKYFFVTDVPGTRRMLWFGGAYMDTTVFVNGTEVGQWKYGYTSFWFDITDALHEGQNEVLVRCNLRHPNSRWYSGAGLYRNVELWEAPDLHLMPDGLYVAAKEGDNGAWTVAVTAEAGSVTAASTGHTLTLHLTDDNGSLLGTAAIPADAWAALPSPDGWRTGKETAIYKASHTFTLQDPALWDLDAPSFYHFTAELTGADGVTDTLTTRFGCRSFAIDPQKGFILNGKPYPLRGVSRHQDRPGIGNALTAKEHTEDMDLICELGANTIRLAHYQHSQTFYDLCDERGMVVWAEIPYISRHMPGGKANTISQMTELICQNSNHPSIVVWGLSNEITMNGASDPSLLENHRALNDLVHKMDPTRPTTIAVLSMCDPGEAYVQIADVLSYNHYFGWYGGKTEMYGPWFDKFHKKYPDRAVGMSEYGCEALNWHTSDPQQGDYTEEYQAKYHEDVIRQIAARPWMWSTHVWNMFDFAADARSEGGENGMNHKGLVTFDRQYKKDAFYAYKAWLSKEPFVHICGKRYVDRTEDVTKVTVYTNQPQVELFANGKSLGVQQKGEYPFFYFDVPNSGETTLTAKAGDCTVESHLRHVNEPNRDYVLQEEGAVINWFEIETPPGYMSINDTIGDILATTRGKLLALRIVQMVRANMKKNKGGSTGGMADMAKGMKINKSLIDMGKGFTVKRVCMMAGGLFTKEQILEINAKLNKIKKKQK